MFIFLASCTSRTIYKKPDDIIPKNQMIDLWVDIYIANGTQTVKNKKLEKRINYFPFIYQKYNIDSVRFMRSNIYYTSKIEEYEEMFQKVEKKLIDIKTVLDPLSEGIDQNLPSYIKDSIRSSKTKKPIDSLKANKNKTNDEIREAEIEKRLEVKN